MSIIMENTSKKIISTAWQCLCKERPSLKHLGLSIFVCFFCMLLGYTLFYASMQIPLPQLQKNISTAHEAGFFQHNYPEVTIIAKPHRVDMYTECFGIGTALQDYKNISDMLLNTSYGECGALSAAVKNNFSSPTPSPYYRYAHGYAAVVRTLYGFFDMQTVRTLTTILSCFLLLVLALSIKIRVSTAHALLIIGAFLLLNSPSMYVLVTHATQFWLVLVASIVATWLRSGRSFFLLMAAVGACDGFFTFLSMGSLSLSMPLLCFILASWAQLHDISQEEEAAQDNKNAYTTATYTILAQGFWACIAWSIGFLLPWLCKWGILHYAFDISWQTIFGDTVTQYKASGISMILLAISKNLLATHIAVWLPLFALLLWIRHKEHRQLPKGLWMSIFPALIPLVWCSLLPGQSGVKHSTFINLILWPCFCYACFYLFTPKQKATFKDLLPLHLRQL